MCWKSSAEWRNLSSRPSCLRLAQLGSMRQVTQPFWLLSLPVPWSVGLDDPHSTVVVPSCLQTSGCPLLWCTGRLEHAAPLWSCRTNNSFQPVICEWKWQILLILTHAITRPSEGLLASSMTEWWLLWSLGLEEGSRPWGPRIHAGHAHE